MCWRSLMTLLFWEWHLIPRWLLRIIFTRFPEQLPKAWYPEGKYSMIDCFLRDALGVFSCLFHKLLDRVVSGVSFLTGCVFECDLAHRRYVAVLRILYKIRCNPMHSLNDALPGPHVPVRVTHGAVIAHRYTYAPLRCRTSQYRITFIPLSVSLDDWRVSRAGPLPF